MPSSGRTRAQNLLEIKNCNMDLTKAGANRFLQINELDAMRLNAYESSISYKERTKRWHDKRIKTPINYEKGDKILLFNLRLWLFPRKLKSRWYGPFSVKPYQKDVLETDKQDDITLDDEGEVTLYLMRRILEVPRKFHWMILGGRFNQLSHVSSQLLSKPRNFGMIGIHGSIHLMKNWGRSRKAHLLEDKQIPNVEVFNTWMTLEGNTRDSGHIWRRNDKITRPKPNL
ncbi:hypothetical protein Tco_0679287 [Tanacetum coccineum]|uniref:Uncharacterized protein n=1 Tax=Tanacetum coccineum TaxID=301880 RepID=A0ABQ4XHE4_9ASTR